MDVHTVLPALTNQLLLELKNLARDETSEEHGDISDELLSALNCVFPTCLSQALDYVDKKAITLVKTPCGRSVFKVKGSNGIPYIVFQSSLYCSCPSYTYTVLMKKTSTICKHILATYISQAIKDNTNIVTVEDEDFPLHCMLDMRTNSDDKT